ncbi:MAG TPA: OmpA family protein [Candidatus Kapabacteria bacterium]|nr:OmpA family protein [Candidatus Kapabacteria bacterium]
MNMYSQQDTLFKNELFGIHLRGGLAFNYYNLNFTSFDGAVDCGLFSNGYGTAFFGEASVEKAISEQFQFLLSLSYFDRSAKFSVINSFESRDLNDNQIVTVNTENYIQTTLNFLEIAPHLKYVLIRDFINAPLRIGIGARIAIPLSKQFVQKERIVSPNNAVFINSGGVRTQVRDLAEGVINTINPLQYGIRADLENLLDIGNGNYFTQSVIFDYNLSDLTNDTKWNIWSLNLGLGIRFSIQQSPQIKPIQKEIEYIEDTKEKPIFIEPKEEEKVFSLKIDSISGLKIETGSELLATIPLVNAVFFDLKSYEIPKFYRQGKIDSLDLFYSDPISVHSYVLQRIANILDRNINSSVILQSSTSGADELNNLELSKMRAEKVRDALISLGISSNKIKIQPLITPINQSNPDVNEGRIENRRVEIIVQNAPLQEYVNFIKYRELAATVNYSVKIKNYDSSEVTIIESINHTKSIINKEGNYSFDIDKRLLNDDSTLTINIQSQIQDSTTKISEKIDLSKAEIINKDYNLDNFVAILMFEYNSSNLSTENKVLLKQLSDKLPNWITIELIGSADIIGTSEYNQELAKQRALNTEKFINSISNNKFIIRTKIMIDKFDDTTPQGRFLNRSIKIRLIK